MQGFQENGVTTMNSLTELKNNASRDTRGYSKVKRAAQYAGVSERTFRKWLKDGLRHSRIGRTILIRYSWIDEYLAKYEVLQDEVNEIVEDILKEF